MGKLVATGLLALIVAAIPAMAADTSWNGLRRLSPGEPVVVVTKTNSQKGDFVGNSAENITVRTRNGETSIARADILYVTGKSAPHRLRNSLIGAGAGAALSLVVDSTVGVYLRNESNPPNARAVIWGIPIGVGAAVGAALPGSKTIYKK